MSSSRHTLYTHRPVTIHLYRFQVIIIILTNASLRDSLTMQLWPLLFGDVEWCMLVVVTSAAGKDIGASKRHVGQDRRLLLGPICCPKTTVPKQKPRPYTITERRTQLLKYLNSQNPRKKGKNIATNNSFPSVASRHIGDIIIIIIIIIIMKREYVC